MTTTATPAKAMTEAPGFLLNLISLGIAMARWVDRTNVTLGRGGAGFWFAWLLPHFAHYGLAKRLNAALLAQGSRLQISTVLCLLLYGVPIIGSRRRLARGAAALVR